MGRKKKEKVAQEQYFAEADNKTEKTVEAKPKQVEKPTPEQIERDYVGVLEYQRKQRENLLGNFSMGEYKIPDGIRAELLNIPKKYGEMENNTARVATMLGRFVLNFKIVFTIDPDICNAKLYIIEIEHDLDDDIKHETLLDEFEQRHSFEFRKVVFEKWNVYYDDDILVKDTLLQSYLHMQEEESLFFGELEMILAQLFIVRMLSFLDKMGELGEKIRVDFKLSMEELLAKNPKLAQDFSFQKRLLDRIIEKHQAFLVIAKDEEGAKILQGYSTPLKNVRDKTYPATVIEPKKTNQEKKSDKKTATKPAIKKSGGQPPKKVEGWIFDMSKVSGYGMSFGGGGVRPMPQLTPQPRPQPTQPRVDTADREQEENTSDSEREAQSEMAELLINQFAEKLSGVHVADVEQSAGITGAEGSGLNNIKPSNLNPNYENKTPELNY